MFNSKYSNFLTILLIVVIVAIIGLLGYLGYDFYRKYYIDKEADEFLAQYEQNISKNDDEQNNKPSEEQQPNEQETENPYESEIKVDNTTNSSGNTTQKYTYKGFTVLGRIQIPKTGIDYPILEKVSKKSLETSVAIMYGPGPNEIGNTTIAGHNYRNGLFFSNNKKLSNGDKINITDNSGQKITYVIYSIYETDPNDTDFMIRDVGNSREISLQTCTDDSKARLVILAKEE